MLQTKHQISIAGNLIAQQPKTFTQLQNIQ